MTAKPAEAIVHNETIIHKKDVKNLSDEDLENELKAISPSLAEAKRIEEAAGQKRAELQQYAEDLYTAAISRQLQTPDGFQTETVTNISIIGGKDALYNLVTGWRSLTLDAITVDRNKLLQNLQPLIDPDGNPLIDLPVKVEKTTQLDFDWEKLAKPQLVIQPQLAHDPLKQVTTEEGGDPKKT